MIDKVHSSTTFMKYGSEKHVNMDDARIIKELRNHPFVVEKINLGYDLANIFFEFHMKVVQINVDDCLKYGISRDVSDSIVFAIRGFADEMYNQKTNGTLLEVKDKFPKNAMVYNRNVKGDN